MRHGSEALFPTVRAGVPAPRRGCDVPVIVLRSLAVVLVVALAGLLLGGQGDAAAHGPSVHAETPVGAASAIPEAPADADSVVCHPLCGSIQCGPSAMALGAGLSGSANPFILCMGLPPLRSPMAGLAFPPPLPPPIVLSV